MADEAVANPVPQKPEVYVKNITFNDGKRFDFNKNDIVVFTGANNVGKSQVLKDILLSFQTNDKNLSKIVTNLEADFSGEIEYYLKATRKDINGNYWTGTGFQNESTIKSWWNRKILVNGLHTNFINFLHTEQRLTASNSPESFNALKDMPRHPIQHLYNDDSKETELSKYFHQAFGEKLILDRCAGNIIPIFVGQNLQMNREKDEDRASATYRKRLNKLPMLQEQGDGMRSFASILLDTFTTQHPVTLIDEPEAFLHPPQARLLGKMLAKNKPATRQMFISTHSEDFLKGLLDADNENIKIIRINRVANMNKMSLLDNDNIKSFWNDPILRYSNILSGLFHSKVVICESDADCRFYQAIMNAKHDGENKISPDILFTHCGGKQRLKTVIGALSSLDVKVLAVSDIDILNDRTIMKDVTDSLGIDWTAIELDWKKVNEYVNSQRPQLNKDDVFKEINTIFESIPATDTNLPQTAADGINKAVKKSSAWSKIKEVGKDFLTGASFTSFKNIDAICRTKGLFIVPVGELESFYKPNSNHGPKWVNEVLESVNLKTDENLRNAHEFVTAITEY